MDLRRVAIVGVAMAALAGLITLPELLRGEDRVSLPPIEIPERGRDRAHDRDQRRDARRERRRGSRVSAPVAEAAPAPLPPVTTPAPLPPVTTPAPSGDADDDLGNDDDGLGDDAGSED